MVRSTSQPCAMNSFCRLLLIWVSSASFQQSAANEWNQFRGPNGSGVLECSPPSLRWSRPYLAPGHPSGHASPVLWGQRLFLTGLEEGLLQTPLLDTRSRHLLWKQQGPKVTLASHHKASSPAASTPCVDEQRVYVYFDSFGLLATTMRARNMETPHPHSEVTLMECPALPSLPMEKFFWSWTMT